MQNFIAGEKEEANGEHSALQILRTNCELSLHTWHFYIVREQHLEEQAFCLRLQKPQCLFNDYCGLLCNYDCMGNPAQSRELLESNDSNLRPCGFVWMLKCLVCGLFARSTAGLMGPFPTCAAFPALDGTLQNEY
jgi:hypothetical protein